MATCVGGGAGVVVVGRTWGRISTGPVVSSPETRELRPGHEIILDGLVYGLKKYSGRILANDSSYV